MADLPLFFTESGEEVGKAAAVGTIDRLAELIGGAFPRSVVVPAPSSSRTRSTARVR